MEDTAVTYREKVIKEIQVLKKECNQLRTRLASQQFNQFISHKSDRRVVNNEVSGSKTEESSHEDEIMSRGDIERVLRITEQMNKMVFSEVTKYEVDDTKHEYQANGTAGPVVFTITFLVNFEEKTKNSLNEGLGSAASVNIIFQNPFHKTELSSWLNTCKRKNELQCLLMGIAQYGEWFEKRQHTCNWLERNFGKVFEVTEESSEGQYIIDAVDPSNRDLLFRAIWKTDWDSSHYKMVPVISFQVEQVTLKSGPISNVFDNLYKCLELTPESVDSLWKKLAQLLCDDYLPH